MTKIFSRKWTRIVRTTTRFLAVASMGAPLLSCSLPYNANPSSIGSSQRAVSIIRSFLQTYLEQQASRESVDVNEERFTYNERQKYSDAVTVFYRDVTAVELWQGQSFLVHIRMTYDTAGIHVPDAPKEKAAEFLDAVTFLQQEARRRK